MHILFASCSEVEVILRGLCLRLDKDCNKHRSMGDLQKVAEPQIHLSDFFVRNIINGHTFPPYQEWRENRVLPWWDAYNGVKHHRVRDFKHATLKHCLYAMAGLYVVNL